MCFIRLIAAFSLVVLSHTFAFCQSPQMVNYQAVARDAESGEELANQAIYLIAKVRSSSPSGDIVYQEEHAEIATNQFGLFSIFIGGGQPQQGTFDQIDWGASPYWLEIDIDAGDGLETIGTMQFVSVPYALHAGTATVAETADNVDDADADPTNEQINSVAFDSANATLTIQESGVDFETDLSGLIDDADADPTNERISSVIFSPSEYTMNITESGTTFSTDLSTLLEDDDADPENELIEVDGLSLINETTLSITEGGVNHQLDLSDLEDDDDWTVEDDGTMHNANGGRVGVGTNSPQSDFQVNGSVGYGITIIESGLFASSYDVLETDHIIVCKTSILGVGTVTIQMPDPTTCIGRIIRIRRTGPFPIVADVEVDFGGFDVDFVDQVVELDELNPQSASYMSLGADGWTEISSND